MRKIRKLLTFSAKCVFRKTLGAWVVLLALSLCVAIPPILYSVTVSIQQQVGEAQKDVYGEFTAIYYTEARVDESTFPDGQAESPSDIEEILADLDAQNYGLVYSWHFGAREESLGIGCLDLEARDLSRIRILEGQMPESPGEIALTGSALQILDQEDVHVGDLISLLGEEWRISGILQEYGRLWPKGEREVEKEAFPPQIVVSREEFVRLTDGSIVNEIVLIQQDLSHPTSYASQEGLYLNTNALTALTSSSGVPVEFMRMLLLILLVFFYSVKMIRKNREEARLRQLRMLGASPGELVFCIMTEMGMQLAAGSLLGIGLSYGASRAILLLVGYWMGVDLPLIISFEVFRSTLFVVWMVGISLTAVELLWFLNPFHHRKRIKYRQRSCKTGCLRLVTWEFSASWMRMAASLVLLAVTIVFLAYSLDYNRQVQETSQHVEVDGKMPFDYDFELYTSLQYPMEFKPEDIGVVDFYERAGATEQDLKELESWEGVSKVLGYKGCNGFLSYDGILNRYIDLEDGMEDGVYYMDDQLSQPMAEILGLEQDRLLASGITGYPEENIEQFRSYVTEGVLDIEKLNAGEEVILVVPAYQYEMSWHGDIPIHTKTPVPWDSPGACNAETFQVGDAISLVHLMPTQNYIGTVQADTVQDYVQPVWCHAKVGAIIRTKVGWFENSTIRNSGHYLITTNDGMESLGMNVTYDRIRVYGDSSSQRLSEQMLAFQEHLPNMALEDAQMELLSYRTFQAATALFCQVMNVLVFLISLLCVLVQLAAKTSRNVMRYSILRVHGLSMKRLRAIWLLSLLLVSGEAFLIAMPIGYFLVERWTVNAICIVGGYLLSLLLGGIVLMTHQVYAYGIQNKEDMND